MEGKRGSECLLKSVSNIDFNPTPYNKVSSFDYLLLVTGFLILVELINIWTNIPTFNSINNVISPIIILLAVFIKLKVFPAGMDEITISTIVLSILIWVLNFRLKDPKTTWTIKRNLDHSSLP